MHQNLKQAANKNGVQLSHQENIRKKIFNFSNIGEDYIRPKYCPKSDCYISSANNCSFLTFVDQYTSLSPGTSQYQVGFYSDLYLKNTLLNVNQRFPTDFLDL